MSDLDRMEWYERGRRAGRAEVELEMLEWLEEMREAQEGWETDKSWQEVWWNHEDNKSERT